VDLDPRSLSDVLWFDLAVTGSQNIGNLTGYFEFLTEEDLKTRLRRGNGKYLVIMRPGVLTVVNLQLQQLRNRILVVGGKRRENNMQVVKRSFNEK